MVHLRAKDLREKSRQELLEELATLEKKLFELRGQKSTSSTGAKLTEIRVTRHDIARVKTVLMEQQRNALQQRYQGSAHVPKDIRPHQVKSLRQKLPAKYALKKTVAQRRRAKFLHPIKFALKAE